MITYLSFPFHACLRQSSLLDATTVAAAHCSLGIEGGGAGAANGVPQLATSWAAGWAFWRLHLEMPASVSLLQLLLAHLTGERHVGADRLCATAAH